MGKKLGIIAAACCAFALCFALVGCGGVDKSAYVGHWVMESSSDTALDQEHVDLLRSVGKDWTMDLKEDGTGSTDIFGAQLDLTWEANSNEDGTITFDNNTAAMKLADGKLSLEDSTGAVTTFAKSDSAASASASAASSQASASGEAAVSSEAASGEAAASDEAASGEAAASDEAASGEAAASDQAASDRAASGEAGASSEAAASAEGEGAEGEGE